MVRGAGSLLGRIWLNYRVLVLATLALLAFGLGVAGFAAAGVSGWDALYDSFALFPLHYSHPPKSPGPALQVARFLAPLVAASATLAAAIALFRDQWDVLRAGTRRGHVILCGLGRPGAALTRSLRAAGHQVVIVERDPLNPEIAEARRLGAMVTAGDPLNANVLERAGIHRAAYLIALQSDDAANAALAARAKAICERGRGGLQVLAHIGRSELADDLTAAALQGSDGRVTLEWFNLYERAARTMLGDHADLLSRSSQGSDHHLVVAGSNDLALSLLLGAGRQWLALAPVDGPRLRVTVVARDASSWIDQVHARYPSLASAAEVVPYERDPRSVRDLPELRDAVSDASALFACMNDDAESIEVAYSLARAGVHAPIVVALLLESAGFRELIGATGAPADPHAPGIHVFGVTQHTLSASMLTDGLHETLAHAIHHTYIAEVRRSEAAKGYEHLCRFQDLPETLKRANRAQARDLRAKLDLVKCDVRPLDDWGTELMEFEEAEVERLAQLEHRRWVAERREAGWSPGPVRDDSRKLNPYLVDWEALPETVREYDRVFIRTLPRALATAGFEVYRLTSPGSPAHAAVQSSAGMT